MGSHPTQSAFLACQGPSDTAQWSRALLQLTPSNPSGEPIQIPTFGTHTRVCKESTLMPELSVMVNTSEDSGGDVI